MDIKIDAEPYPITFGPTTPTPEDFTLSIELTWLSRDAGIAVAEARIHTTARFTEGRSYWLKTLIGPDGHHDLDTHLFDAFSISFGGIKQHAFTYDEIIAAVREHWEVERGS